MRRFRTLLLLLFASISSVMADDARPNRRKTSAYTIGPAIQPLVIYGEGWSQQFTIINVDYYQSGEPTIGTLRFFTRDGQPWRIPLKGFGTVDQVPVNLPSGRMLVVETEVSQQPQQLGWAYLVLPDSNAWGIYLAFTTFRKQTAGRPDLMTNVPFVDDLEDELIIPMDNRDGKYPGIGLVNSSSRSAAFTLRVYDTAGNLRKTINKNVGALSLHWFSLIAENPDLDGLAGQITVRGGLFSSAAFTLQFTPNGAFTALPVVHTFGMP